MGDTQVILRGRHGHEVAALWWPSGGRMLVS